jgi:[acyl-carrier-protein] S-malonyltransferase
MGKVALLFPGQGSQRVGMGRDLSFEFPRAKRTFEEADAALGFALSKLCWDGPEDDLTLTANTQPAILTNSIAVLRVLEEEKGLTIGAPRGASSSHGSAGRDRPLTIDMCAGHSLGEWSALVAAGALAFADAVRLVRLRGQAMQEAVPAGQGAMAALIGLDAAAVNALCAEVAQGEVVAAANFNGAGQIVVAGAAAAVARVMAGAKGKGAKLAKALPVSAPFHCALMKPAAEKLAAALETVQVAEPRVPVVSNVEAAPHPGAARVKELLVSQVTSPVRWEECVQRLAADGVDRGLELGSGSVLSGLVKRIAPVIKVSTIGEPHEVRGYEA